MRALRKFIFDASICILLCFIIGMNTFTIYNLFLAFSPEIDSFGIFALIWVSIVPIFGIVGTWYLNKK